MNPFVMALAKLDLFENMTLRELESIFRSSNAAIFTYKPNETIKFRGEECNELLILLMGEIETRMQNEAGKVVIIENIKAPYVLASAFLFSSKNVYPVDVVAKSEVKLISILKEKVIEICQSNQKFLLNFLRNMGDRISILSEKLYLLSLSDLKERIARYLLTISRGEEKFKIPITKEELSKILGVTRPSLSRTFSELTKEGIIEQIRSEIIIRDIERLKKLIKE